MTKGIVSILALGLSHVAGATLLSPYYRCVEDANDKVAYTLFIPIDLHNRIGLVKYGVSLGHGIGKAALELTTRNGGMLEQNKYDQVFFHTDLLVKFKQNEKTYDTELLTETQAHESLEESGKSFFHHLRVLKSKKGFYIKSKKSMDPEKATEDLKKDADKLDKDEWKVSSLTCK